MGTTDAQQLRFRTSNIERARFFADGRVVINGAGAFPGTSLNSFAGGTGNAIGAEATGSGNAILGQNTGTGMGLLVSLQDPDLAWLVSIIRLEVH